MLNHLLYSCYDYNKKTIFSIENNIYDIAIKNNNIDAFNILLYHDIECDNFMEDSSFFNIKKLKYLINKGYKASTRFINLIIKNKGNEGVDLLKLIFQNINYNNEIIINFLFHCKNKLPFSQAELNNIINEENEKLRNILNTREGRFSISYFDENIDFPLIIACQNKYNDVIKLLVEYGANINTKICLRTCQLGCCSTCSSPLTIAIRNKNESIVKYLIEHGADINAVYTGYSCDVPDDNYTALYVALGVKNEFIIKCLIEHGADVNAKAYYGNFACTPLIYACREENEFIVKYLIENGADVNDGITIYNTIDRKIIPEKITPLSIAYEKGNESLIEVLVKSHALEYNDYDDIDELMLDNEYENGYGYGYMKFSKDIYDIEIKQNFKYINKKNKNKPKNRKNNIKNNNNKKRMRIKKEIKKKTQMKKLKK